jgi:hypothetical protein
MQADRDTKETTRAEHGTALASDVAGSFNTGAFFRAIQPESAVYGALPDRGELRVTLPMRPHLYSMHAGAATDASSALPRPRHC